MSDYTIKVSATNYAAAVSFEDYYNLYYLIELNRISEFRFVAYDLSAAQKAVLIEDNTVYILYDTTLILKSKIRKADIDDEVEDYHIEGNGMEIDLLDRDVRGREEWNDTAADTIVKSLISGIMTEGTIESAIKVGFRAEEDSVLRACVSLAKAIDWDWYVDQDGTFNTDRLNFVANKGETSSQETFELGNDIFWIQRSKDVDNVFNVLRVLGYGDGINQIMSESFYATTNRATLSAAISATATSVTVSESISSFPASGNLRCGREWLVYSSKNDGTKTFTISARGNIPGTNPPTDNPYYIAAYAHKKGAEIFDLQYSNGGFATKATAQSGTSIATYGLRDNLYADQAIRNQSTVDLLAQRLISKYKMPVERIELSTAKEKLTAEIGDIVSIKERDTSLTEYRLLKEEFSYDDYSMSLILGNAQDFFLEEIGELKKKMGINSVYGLGNTVAFSLPPFTQDIEKTAADNFYSYMQFKIPTNCIAINALTLFWYIDKFRVSSKTAQSKDLGTKTSSTGATKFAMCGMPLTQEGINLGTFPVMTTTIPNTPGTFYSHIHLYSISNRSGGNRTYTYELKDITDNQVIDSGSQAINDNAYYVLWTIEYTDRKGNTLQWKHNQNWGAGGHDLIELKSYTTIKHDHQVVLGSHDHTIDYGTQEEAGPANVIKAEIKVGSGSWTALGGSPYTGDQTEVDIKDLIGADPGGKRIQMRFLPNANGRCWLRGGGDTQMFIESK